MKKLLIAVLAVTLVSTARSECKDEPIVQDWSYHAWMAQVAVAARQQNVSVEDADEAFTQLYEPDHECENYLTPERAVGRFVKDREDEKRMEAEKEAAFDKWWSEVKSKAPALGYEIKQDSDAQRTYFHDERFPNNETPEQAIAAALEHDAAEQAEIEREADCQEVEARVAVAHGLTPDETDAFHEWAANKRAEAETDEEREPLDGEALEALFSTWRKEVAEEEAADSEKPK